LNLKEYKNWLERNSNREEKEGFKVVQEIVKYHSLSKEWKYIQVFPRTKYKGVEFDLLILLSDETKKLKDDFWGKLIGVEFKETDVKKVVKQAVQRREYVSYQYIATKDVYLDYPEIFLLCLFGIGWIVWGDGFAKMIIPSKIKFTYDKIETLVNYLIDKKLSDIIDKMINRKITDFLRG